MPPLDGIRVLDFSRHNPGRYSSMILADLGAEVITVETPKNSAKSLSFQFTDDTWYRYLGMNCNKKSIAVNLKNQKGKELIYRLVDNTDVLIEANRPGVAKRLGIDYETLSKRNPKLIYCSISGYGQDSPYADRGSHDINVVAMTGILNSIGAKEGSPIYFTFPCMSDISAWCLTLASITSALYSREKTGKGQYLDISITDGMMFSNWVMNMRYLATGDISERSMLPTGSDIAWLNVYRTSDDKFVALSCQELRLWTNLCRLMNCEQFIEHHFTIGEKQKEIFDYLSGIFKTKTRDEWMKLLDEAGVAAAPVYDIAEALSDTHFKSSGIVTEVDHPKLGSVKLLASPLRFSDTPVNPRTRPPLYGENTSEILSTVAGITATEIEELMNEGVIE